MSEFPKETEVFIVGGGPAGLAAAIAARGRGLDVTVADAAVPPIEKACGEGLMPDSVEALRRLGVTLEGGQPFHGIRFVGSGGSVEANFPGGCGIGIRRPRIHQTMAGHAERAGAKLLWGTRVTGLSARGVLMDGRETRCRWVIGADGQNSRVRRWAGLDAARRQSNRFGFRRHYPVKPWTRHMEIHWGSGCQVYVTPVSPEEVCVALISRDPHLRLDAALAGFAELRERLGCVNSSTPERGGVSASRSLWRVYRGGTALIGDASGSVDAITGEGLCLAFQQAAALAEALERGDLRMYARAHRRSARRPSLMAGLMLSLDTSDWLRARVLAALERRPRIFERMLSMHVGSLGAGRFLTEAMLPLVWQVIGETIS